jgi:hypothetical protein
VFSLCRDILCKWILTISWYDCLNMCLAIKLLTCSN